MIILVVVTPITTITVNFTTVTVAGSEAIEKRKLYYSISN